MFLTLIEGIIFQHVTRCVCILAFLNMDFNTGGYPRFIRGMYLNGSFRHNRIEDVTTFSLTLSALITVSQLSLFIATCKECRFRRLICLTFFVTGGSLMHILGLSTKYWWSRGGLGRKLEYLTYWEEIGRRRSYLLLEISPSSLIQNVYKVALILAC